MASRALIYINFEFSQREKQTIFIFAFGSLASVFTRTPGSYKSLQIQNLANTSFIGSFRGEYARLKRGGVTGDVG